MDGATALARRYYLHVEHGGQLTSGNVSTLVSAMERKDAEIASLQEQLAAEKALADRLGRFVIKLHGETTAATAYRKARGL